MWQDNITDLGVILLNRRCLPVPNLGRRLEQFGADSDHVFEPVRNWFGTRSEPVRNPFGTWSEPVRDRFGTGSGRVRNRFGTGSVAPFGLAGVSTVREQFPKQVSRHCLQPPEQR